MLDLVLKDNILSAVRYLLGYFWNEDLRKKAVIEQGSNFEHYSMGKKVPQECIFACCFLSVCDLFVRWQTVSGASATFTLTPLSALLDCDWKKTSSLHFFALRDSKPSYGHNDVAAVPQNWWQRYIPSDLEGPLKVSLSLFCLVLTFTPLTDWLTDWLTMYSTSRS